jgi:hypothetical protein
VVVRRARGHLHFSAGEQTITAITRRTGLQQDILGALEVDTRAWTRPAITS